VRFRGPTALTSGTVKFVPLSADGTTSLSLGGEARVTYERFGNQNFGLTAPAPDGFRAIAHAGSLAARRLGSAAGGRHGIPEFDGCA